MRGNGSSDRAERDLTFPPNLDFSHPSQRAAHLAIQPVVVARIAQHKLLAIVLALRVAPQNEVLYVRAEAGDWMYVESSCPSALDTMLQNKKLFFIYIIFSGLDAWWVGCCTPDPRAHDRGVDGH